MDPTPLDDVPPPSPARRICGAMVRSGGLCRACGHKPPRGEDNRFPVHRGTCPACGVERAMIHDQSVGLAANGRCRLHGGKSLTGIASPTYRTGLHSKTLPAHLRAGYERSRKHPDPQYLREQSHVYQAMIEEIWLRFQDGGGLRLWTNLLESVEGLGAGIRGNDPPAIVAAYGRLRELCRRGKDDETNLAKVLDLMERQGRAEERVNRQQEREGRMISQEQAWALIMGLVNSVRRHVTDESLPLDGPTRTYILQAVSRDVERLTGGGESPRTVEDAPDQPAA